MHKLMRISGIIFGVAAGGTVGGWIGWSLGDFGGRSDPENIWFLFMIAGAAVGLAVSLAIVLRRAKQLGWGASLLIGAIIGAVAATAVVLLVSWRGRP
jgi:hypothetical protein